MNPKIDNYLSEGCGRCPLGGTDACKVRKWPAELAELRRVVLDCGLTEELKWGMPCYTFDNNNVLMLAAFNDFASLSFFKGALLKDAGGLMDRPGENSQAVRRFRFTDVKAIRDLEPSLRAYIFEAIEVEKAGLKIDFKAKDELVFPAELIRKWEEDPAFKAAFDALTPGRQRGYNIFFTAPKQSKTRESRIEKAMPKIFEGKGWNER